MGFVSSLLCFVWVGILWENCFRNQFKTSLQFCYIEIVVPINIFVGI